MKGPVIYGRKRRLVYSTDSFGSSGEINNSFVLVSSSGEDSVTVRMANASLWFTVGVRERFKSQNNVF